MYSLRASICYQVWRRGAASMAISTVGVYQTICARSAVFSAAMASSSSQMVAMPTPWVNCGRRGSVELCSGRFFQRFREFDCSGADLDLGHGGRHRRRADDKACTFVGTAAYVPLEVLNSSPATFGNDLWALGCSLYQMLSGTSPFKDASEWLIFQRIIARDIRFPSHFSEEARDLIDHLLEATMYFKKNQLASGSIWMSVFGVTLNVLKLCCELVILFVVKIVYLYYQTVLIFKLCAI